MKNRYYLIASLPTLKWGGAPPISVRKFLELCSDYLTQEEKKIIESLSLTPSTGATETKSLAGKWLDWETFLRNRIAISRAKNKNLHLDKTKYSERGFYSVAERVAQNALSSENPLDKEKILDLSRWKAIEDFSALSQFDFDALIAYKLKLELLSKYSSMDKNLGWEKFKELRENILKKEELI